ncbi:MAG: ABC transporter ATP-binding protein [Nitrososphaera sp.]|nr:ABC transporter ATP-binding protein [Nitrososphaera sp.]
MTPLILTLERVSKSFPDKDGRQVLSNLDLTLSKGDFLSVVGPSGCGKTTMLRIMAGLLPSSSGIVSMNGEPRNPIGNVVLLFQDYGRSLLPWRTVLRNVTLGIEELPLTRSEQDEKANRFIQLVGLSEFAMAYPGQLSGGMQQRVALARALVRAPSVLLMDEPFGSLDARTRESLEDQLLQLWAELKLTIVFVTHDIDEAIYLGQKVVVLTDRPATISAIEFVGLEYPRNQISSREDPLFLSLRRTLYRSLHPHTRP